MQVTAINGSKFFISHLPCGFGLTDRIVDQKATPVN